jgi:O-antigen ligase/tRNA A-37 threonylcarbamoyl transferase component Bud32
MQSSALRDTSNRIFDFICLWILPLGYLLLLCSMFFLPGRGSLHKLYYALFSIPTLLALCLRPSELKGLWREPAFTLVLLYLGWATLSLTWSPDVDNAFSEIKTPLHTLMLFLGCCLLVRHRRDVLHPIIFTAALVALAASVFNLYGFAMHPKHARMVGAGAFDNPLLSSHVFGFFCSYWLFLSMTCQRRQLLWLSIPALVVMFAAVIATGSRTPMVALTLAAMWLAFICWNRRSLILLGTMFVGGTAILITLSHMLIERGSSYRFELWQLALNQISAHPWIGHGYQATLALPLSSLGITFEEPHNFALGVLYYVGAIGLLLWLLMQAWSLLNSWRLRAQPLLILASTWLMFGIGAGLTEGGGILSRPKEHWFLLWIPLALIIALSINQRAKRLLATPVKRLQAQALDTLTRNAHVIEEDGLGPKVLRLDDGSFLKIFRCRSWYTSGGFNPYSERFAVNSLQLSAMGITTPEILGLYQLPDNSGAVRYQPLPGQTVRQQLQATDSAEARNALMKRFGRFMGQLHEQGVYFRSLHLANVLVLENGEFGLIDLADLRIYPSALPATLRQRNLRHMQRYAEDRAWLFEEHVEALLQGYGEAASSTLAKRLQQQILLTHN